MPPKRSKQISESTNMRKKSEFPAFSSIFRVYLTIFFFSELREDQNAIKAGKMAAQHSNTADLRALVST